MFKVLLLIIMYNTQTGEIAGIWQDNGKMPAFESMQQCEEVLKNEVPKAQLPPGFSVDARCIEPGAINGPVT